MGYFSQSLLWLWPTVDLKYSALTLVLSSPLQSALGVSSSRPSYLPVRLIARRVAQHLLPCALLLTLFICPRRRLYEMLVVYSLPIKAIIHEKVR